MAFEIIHGLNSYLTFRLDANLLAVNIGQITKILKLTEITKMPNSPEYLRGIINLFGDVIPVFDGRLKFGFPETESTRETCILVFAFELDGQVVSSGIIVDSVEKVLIFEPGQIQTGTDIGNGFNAEFINGIISFNDEPVIILNFEQIFSKEEIKLVNPVD